MGRPRIHVGISRGTRDVTVQSAMRYLFIFSMPETVWLFLLYSLRNRIDLFILLAVDFYITTTIFISRITIRVPVIFL